MERGFKVSETIARPVDQVWRALTDFQNGAGWMGVTGMRTLGGKAPGKGTEISFTARGQEMRSTITEWQPPRRLTLRSVQGGIAADYTYGCTARGEATEVTLDVRCTATGFPWRLLHPLIALLMKRADSGQLRKLKAILEAAPPAAPPATAGTSHAPTGKPAAKRATKAVGKAKPAAKRGTAAKAKPKRGRRA